MFRIRNLKVPILKLRNVCVWSFQGLDFLIRYFLMLSAPVFQTIRLKTKRAEPHSVDCILTHTCRVQYRPLAVPKRPLRVGVGVKRITVDKFFIDVLVNFRSQYFWCDFWHRLWFVPGSLICSLVFLEDTPLGNSLSLKLCGVVLVGACTTRFFCSPLYFKGSRN